MVQGKEIVLLILGIGVLFFIIGNRSRLRKLPSAKILITGFILFFVGWVFTVLEGIFWEKLLNLIEHILYLGGAILIAKWCWKIFVKKES